MDIQIHLMLIFILDPSASRPGMPAIQIHLMLIFIPDPINSASTELSDSNTSHVNLYQEIFIILLCQKRIQIHLMLIFIGMKFPRYVRLTNIQIHLMLIFIY